jgi:hypothetical protein
MIHFLWCVWVRHIWRLKLYFITPCLLVGSNTLTVRTCSNWRHKAKWKRVWNVRSLYNSSMFCVNFSSESQVSVLSACLSADGICVYVQDGSLQQLEICFSTSNHIRMMIWVYPVGPIHIFAWSDGRKIQKLQDVIVRISSRYPFNVLRSECTRTGN